MPLEAAFAGDGGTPTNNCPSINDSCYIEEQEMELLELIASLIVETIFVEADLENSVK